MIEKDELLLELENLKEENRILQEQIETLQTKVHKANEINNKKNTLIAQISHEIRTPLNVVIGMSSIAKDNLENKDIVRDNLSEIENSSRILLGIVDNILDVSSLASGNLIMHSNKFDLKEQITSLGVFFYEHAKDKGVHFGIHIKGVSEEYLIGDEKRFQQILTNLFENSLHYTPAEGQIDLTVIQGSTSRNRVHMRFVLKDTGRGVPSGVLDELFVPYDKSSIHTHSYTDTGINLYVTKQLVQALGGTIEIKAYAGDGNTIIVDLPFEKTKQQELNFGEIKNHRVLLVADETVCEERGEMLADMGISYGIAHDAYEALDVLGEADDLNQPFNVCMVDMNMNNAYPEVLIQEIKSIFGENPIIIATSHDKQEIENKQTGADYIIDNTLFRSTIFDALMILEKGKIYKQTHVVDLAQRYDFSKKRILVVEDVALNMEVVVKLLSKVNASIVCAENGEEALQTFIRKPAGYFDCILMDVNMPVMDGYEATRQIRNSQKEDAAVVPIYAMTANAFSEDVTEALQSGMNGHIAKPIDLKILYSTLNKEFNNYENQEISDELLERAMILEEQNKQLKERAEHDPLTGLYNRYAYQKEIYSLLRKKDPVGFLLIDIDHFKEINDIFGHEIGDSILVHVANTLKASVNKDDFVVRIGGDEFGIIIKKYENDPQILYETVKQVNDLLLNGSDELPGVTLSVGAAFSDIGYTTEMYNNADKALYQTKKNGRKGCTIFDESQWNESDDLEKMNYRLNDYMNFTLDARGEIGDLISIISYRLLEYSLKFQLEEMFGQPKQIEIFQKAGFGAGVYFTKEYLNTSLSLEEFIDQLAQKMQTLKIGNLVLNEMDANTGEALLSVYEDADCSGLISFGETVCHYDEGFIAGILSIYTKKRYTAKEIECWAKGDQVCRFIAKPEKEKI